MDFNYDLYPGRILKQQNFEESDQRPIISIITSFYNDYRYIETTAKSILNQTFPYFEWIIVDDGSTDEKALEKLDEIGKIDSRIRILHKKNGGAAETRDYGVTNSDENTKYIIFLDSDDVINETYLECAYWTLITNPQASFAYTDVINFDERKFLWQKYYTPQWEKKDNILVVTALIKKEAFLKVKGFEVRGKNLFEDWYLWLKMMKEGMIPVRMNYLGFWYRQKNKKDSQLQRAKNDNQKEAMNSIKKIVKSIKNEKDAIQYPKQDYNWEDIPDQVNGIVIPKVKKDKKTKILLIIPWMVVGGADKFNLDVVSKTNNEKYEFIIVTTESSNNPWRQQFEEYSTVYDLTSFLNRKYWVSFINYLIEKNNIDIVFNTNSTFGYSAIPYIKTKHPEIPIMDYVHMEEWYNRNGGFSRDSSAVSDFIDKTFLCNKNSSDILINHFGRKSKEVETCYIGVDEKKFNPELYKKQDILKKFEIKPNGKYILSFICRIAEQKRPYLLLEFIKRLREQRDDFILVVAGDGPMLDEIKSKAETLKINDIIYFLGNISKTEEIYAISDITLNCSIKEGLALTAYESISMGVPVVSSDVGGQKELINEDVGVIVPCMQKETEIRNFTYSKEEIESYVDGINIILSNLDVYKSKCRERILNGFTIDNMVSNMEKIFDEIKQNPNKEKIENARLQSLRIQKELITLYFIAYKDEYNWLCKEYNRKNVDVLYIPKNEKLKGKANPMYEYTLEYKIKHPIVVFLRKIGIYNFCKKLLGRGENE